MDIKQYIASGILELYVSGNLSAQEQQEVHRLVMQYPELQAEVAKIEAAFISLAEAKASAKPLETPKVIGRTKQRPAWLTYGGWAAATLATVGLISQYLKNDELQVVVEDLQQQEIIMESELASERASKLITEELLSALRSPDVQKIPLAGQGDFDSSFAAVYRDAEAQTIYLDVNGLPEAPAGMQYQLWSLTLDPLTPTSLGVLDNDSEDLNLFIIDDPNTTEAYGITLEPEGGSESPTLEQLYVLGTVETTP